MKVQESSSVKHVRYAGLGKQPSSGTEAKVHVPLDPVPFVAVSYVNQRNRAERSSGVEHAPRVWGPGLHLQHCGKGGKKRKSEPGAMARGPAALQWDNLERAGSAPAGGSR